MGRLKFSEAETRFLKRNEMCRIATSSKNIPHVVPVSYIFEEGTFIFATDYGTKKLENIKENKRVALTVDVYGSAGNKAVCVQGIAEVIDDSGEFERLYRTFYRKFEWVRSDPWQPGDAPFVRVTPLRKVSWGIK